MNAKAPCKRVSCKPPYCRGDALSSCADGSFLESAQTGKKAWHELMHGRGTRTDTPMKPQVVAHELNKLLADDAIVATDSGTITTWAARRIEMRGE